MPPSNAPSWAISNSAIITNSTEADSDHDLHLPSTSELPDSVTPNTSTHESDNHTDNVSDISSDIDSDPELENWIQEATGVRN